MPDRRDSFGEDGITDIFLTSGKTSLYTMMGMMNSATVRQMFGGGSDLVPLEMHIVEPGLMSGFRKPVMKIATVDSLNIQQHLVTYH